MAAEKLAMVCGGASGVDQIAQDALLDAGGVLILIPAVEADQICRRKREAEALKKRRLLLVCETLPDAPFSAQKALMRNHTIYAMGRAAIVVASRKNMGGSWHGATDCLRDGFSPVYAIDETGRDYEGNRALITEHHAKPFDLEKSMRRQLGYKRQRKKTNVVQVTLTQIPTREILHFLGWHGTPVEPGLMETIKRFQEKAIRKIEPRVVVPGI